MRLLYVIPFIICIFLILLTFNSRNWENQPDKIPKPLGEMPIPIHQKSEENKQSQPFKNQEQNIIIETEPNSYHTTTYKINNRTQTPPPQYPSRSPDPTINSETKNLEKLNMDINSVNHVEMQTKYILIVSTWRSGSTFFGDLLTQYPGTYYSYEPLQYLSKRVNH